MHRRNIFTGILLLGLCGVASSLVAPPIVYSANVSNALDESKVVLAKFETIGGETMEKNVNVKAGGSVLIGPYEYTQGSTTYAYVLNSISVLTSMAKMLATAKGPYDVEGVTEVLYFKIMNSQKGDVTIGVSRDAK